MRRQKKTFQQRVVLYGRALPLMLFLLLGSWVVSLYVEPSVPAGGGSLLQEMLTGLLPGERRLQLGAGLLLYVGIGFLLIPLNTQLVFIRARASAQTTFFFFWLALLPFLHASLYALCPLGQGIANRNTVIISPHIEHIVLARSPQDQGGLQTMVACRGMVAIQGISLVDGLCLGLGNERHVPAQVYAIHHESQPGRLQEPVPLSGSLAVELVALGKHSHLHLAIRTGDMR